MARNFRRVEYGRARSAVINAAFNMRQKPTKEPVALTREQQTEAAKLDAAIAKNLENIGYGKQ